MLKKAIAFALQKHEGQLDDAGKPFINHPLQTMQLLMNLTEDEEILCAAVLHDTLEDTETTLEELVQNFGERIAGLVYEVTHERNAENTAYIFPRLKSRDAILIKFADRLSNLSRMESWDSRQIQRYLNKSKFWNS